MISESANSWKNSVSDFHTNNARLQASIKRLSSGDSFVVPGGAPAGLAISERMRAQIANTTEAIKNIKHAQSALQTVDSWLQEANNIVTRMGALATASIDGSKSAEDRANLDKEFQELKEEMKRISSEVEYNGLKVMGGTAVVTYDNTKQIMRYMHPDGSQMGSFTFNNTSTNGETFNFDWLRNFLITDDGKSLVFLDNGGANYYLRKYDIETGVVTPQAASLIVSATDKISMSDTGDIYLSDRFGGTNRAVISKLNLEDMSLDGAPLTGSAHAATDFAISGDYIIYQDWVSFDIVRQHVTNADDITTLYSGLGAALDSNGAISKDGQYMVERSAPDGYITVTNLLTQEQSEIFAGNDEVARLNFDANNNIYGRENENDTNYLVKIELGNGDKPEAISREIVYDPDDANKMLGISVGGGSPISRAHFQVGADQGMKIESLFADIELTDLRISDLNVKSMDSAETALEALGDATNKINDERATLGAQISRLTFTSAGTHSYNNNIAQAESMIRDADVAKDTAELAADKLRSQMALGMISETNEMTLSLLSLIR